MNIIKSFTDENGQEVLIQGAGTDYNPELNSLAIGEGTVAVGEDQFVFGRYNTSETDKVEIVGAGYQEQFQAYDLGEQCAGHTATWSRVYYGGKNIEELVQAFKVMYNNCEVTFEVLTSLPDDIVTFLILERDRVSEGKISASLYFRTSDGTWYDFSIAYLGLNTYTAYIKEEITSVQVRFAPGIITSSTAWEDIYQKLIKTIHNGKNIRTLDWEGNEVLAGELTATKVITPMVETQNITFTDGTYTREITAEEVYLIPKMVTVTSQDTARLLYNVSNVSDTIHIQIPDISIICTLLQQNKYLKIIEVPDAENQHIWELEKIENTNFTFKNVKTDLSNNVINEIWLNVNTDGTSQILVKRTDIKSNSTNYYSQLGEPV